MRACADVSRMVGAASAGNGRAVDSSTDDGQEQESTAKTAVVSGRKMSG